MKRYVAVVAFPLLILGCDAPPETIAGKIMVKVEQVCAFRADQAWLTALVAKMDATIQMADQLATAICNGVIQSRTQQTKGLTSSQCPNGYIIVESEVICIEGEDAEEEGK